MTFWADGIKESLEDNPVIRKARWEQIEYPAILRHARELDRRRLLKLEGVKVPSGGGGVRAVPSPPPPDGKEASKE